MYEPAAKAAPERSIWHWVTGSIVVGAGGYAMLAAASWLIFF